MKLFKTTKSKVVLIALAVFLVAGGAVAGASSPGFATTIQGYVNSLSTKLSALIGKEVENKAEIETAAVKEHVTAKFNAASGQIVSHYSLQMQQQTDRLVANKNTAKTEIDAAVTSATSQVKDKITETARTEVDAAIEKMNEDITDHINTLMQQAESSIPQ